MIWDMISRYIAIYHAISHRIASKHQANTNSTKTHHLVVVYSCFFRLCLCPHLGLSSVWPFLSSFCCPSAGHIIIGLTVPPANSSLVPSGLGLLPERMFVLFHFSFYLFIFFHSLSFLLLDTWYLVPGTPQWLRVHVNVIGHFRLMLCCCREKVDVVYAIHI